MPTYGLVGWLALWLGAMICDTCAFQSMECVNEFKKLYLDLGLFFATVYAKQLPVFDLKDASVTSPSKHTYVGRLRRQRRLGNLGRLGTHLFYIYIYIYITN